MMGSHWLFLPGIPWIVAQCPSLVVVVVVCQARSQLPLPPPLALPPPRHPPAGEVADAAELARLLVKWQVLRNWRVLATCRQWQSLTMPTSCMHGNTGSPRHAHGAGGGGRKHRWRTELPQVVPSIARAAVEDHCARVAAVSYNKPWVRVVKDPRAPPHQYVFACLVCKDFSTRSCRSAS